MSYKAMMRKNQNNEVNTLPSLTVPDETLTIREILIRYAKGLPISSSHREPIYNEDYDGENPMFLDLTEVDDLRDELQEKQQVLSKNLKTIENEKIKRKAKKEAQQSEEE